MFVRKETLVRDLQGFARWLVAQQLMGRAVRQLVHYGSDTDS